MKRVVAAVGMSAALAALAACADSTRTVAGPADMQPSLAVGTDNPAAIHIMLTRAGAEEARRQASPDAKPGNTGIIYHGGPILYQTNVAAVYWASSPIFTNGPAAGTNS